MDKVTFIKVAGIDGIEEDFAIIDKGNGDFTSMPKSVYDEQQAALKTPLVINETPVE